MLIEYKAWWLFIWFFSGIYEMLWYYLSNLKMWKTAIEECSFYTWVLFTFLKLDKWYQIAQRITVDKRVITAWKVPVMKLFWFAFSRIRTWYGEILRIFTYSVRIRENADQNNFEYGHFSRSEYHGLKAGVCFE